MVTSETEISAFLVDEDFATAWSQHKARAVLEQAGLTRPGKKAMASEQLPGRIPSTCPRRPS